MNLKEIADKLSGKFENWNKYDLDDFTDWCKSNNLSDKQLEDLYYFIIYQYKKRTFPPLGVIIEIWDKNKFSYSDNDIKYLDSLKSYEGRWSSMTARQIINSLSTIRSRLTFDLQKTRLIEKEFYYQYSDCLYEYQLMIDNNYPENKIMAHVEYVRKQIESKKTYKSISTEILQSKKPLDSIIKKTFTQLEDAI